MASKPQIVFADGATFGREPAVAKTIRDAIKGLPSGWLIPVDDLAYRIGKSVEYTRRMLPLCNLKSNTYRKGIKNYYGKAEDVITARKMEHGDQTNHIGR